MRNLRSTLRGLLVPALLLAGIVGSIAILIAMDHRAVARAITRAGSISHPPIFWTKIGTDNARSDSFSVVLLQKNDEQSCEPVRLVVYNKDERGRRFLDLPDGQIVALQRAPSGSWVSRSMAYNYLIPYPVGTKVKE